MKFYHDLDIINVNNITISIFIKNILYRRKSTRPVLQTMFVIRARWFNTGRVKHTIDGETSYHYSTNQINCYIYDTIYDTITL